MEAVLYAIGHSVALAVETIAIIIIAIGTLTAVGNVARIRTSLSLIGFGFTLYQVFEKLREAGVLRSNVSPRLSVRHWCFSALQCWSSASAITSRS